MPGQEYGAARLFALPPSDALIEPTAAGRFQALGKAAEYAAIGRLLEAGHKVAVPVTDDDGVDLVVNYRTTVQVKSGEARANQGTLTVNLQSMRSAERSRLHAVRDHVDIYVIRARDTGEWWIIPRSAMPNGASITLGRRFDQWRDAWSLFG